ncbi:membrane dipeptidase (Peptidase family m19) domain-containing protein [Sarocladium implicatum]|nr:membrane dipeptidase (Peptidase family m19) domain-containing protein [Sarocladium implicatum]
MGLGSSKLEEDGHATTPESRAAQLLRTTPLADGHNDFAWMIRGWLQNRVDDTTASTLRNMPIGQTDLQRLKASALGCQIWSAYVPDPSQDDDYNTEPQLKTLRTTLQQLDALHTMFELHSSVFGYVDRARDILPMFRSGRIASLIGIEGLHQIANSASAVLHNGLSVEGQAMIQEMNRLGMMIDLSHTSHDVQKEVLALSEAPVLYSHSSCYSLRNSPRNVTDENLDKLKLNGGIIMICFLPSLVDPGDGSDASIEHIADHIEYAGRRIGYSHVGIGSDFDGMLNGPLGMDDVSCYPRLVAELIRRGLREDEISQVMGLNLVRVLTLVERTAERLKAQGAAILFDEIPSVWTDEQKAMLLEAGRARQNNQASA